ncbi:hypothetical protein CANCADRAFT_1714 [Tortispora caseinolytica NRRL Y-17796]|uniref:HPt domain-containing protein n=1 Tax=Tortispora caseinolytica NRRL Y-17796 TaxID=767744 RepID=A0A1E4TE05_9ASCO|nr:hypothetical protein CANCADRAFT_1714 [Tortispora caseinolytica NRRL Y-17796]
MTDTSIDIDWEVLNQILEMDDDPKEREFSKGLVSQFFDQADTILSDIFRHLESQGDLNHLSSQGHFLKGSSAALGLTRMRIGCEKIQHLGNYKDETGTSSIDDETFLRDSIKQQAELVRKAYKEYYAYLHDYFGSF